MTGVVWRLRSCPRCKGDVVVDRDLHGWYEWCLQCGHRRYRDNVAEKPLNVVNSGSIRKRLSKGVASRIMAVASAGSAGPGEPPALDEVSLNLRSVVKRAKETSEDG